MAIAELTGQRGTAGGPASTTSTVTYTSTPTQGNLMVAMANVRGDVTPTVLPSGWSQAVTANGAGNDTYVFWKIAGASEPLTHNWTWSGSFKTCMVWGEWSGIAATNPVDVSNSGTATSGTASTGATGTLSQADELVIAAFGGDTNGTFSAYTANYTEIGQVSSTGGAGSTRNTGAMVARIVAATTSQTVTATWSASTSVWTAAVVTFKAPSATNAPAGNASAAGTAYNATGKSSPVPLVAPVAGVNILQASAAFDGNIAGWAAHTPPPDPTGTSTVTYDGAEGHSSLGSMKVVQVDGDVLQAVARTGYVHNLALQTWVYSLWVKTTTATQVVMVIRHAGGSFNVVRSTTAGVWTRVSFDRTDDGNFLRDVAFGIRSFTADTFWVDEVMVEYKAAVPPSDFVVPGIALPGAASVKASAGVASATGSVTNATVDTAGNPNTNVDAGLAAASVAAQGVVATVRASAATATPSGAANALTRAVRPSAQAAAATGAAQGITGKASTTSGVATPSGSAGVPGEVVATKPSAATASGAGQSATVQTTAGTDANAGVATASVSALSPGGGSRIALAGTARGLGKRVA